jgi:Tfp pilus assembly protein PilX
MARSAPRGSALLLTMIVVLVLAVLGIAMIRFAARELAGATAARQNEALVSCAEAGRQLILSQFRSTTVSPASLAALNVPLSAAGSARAIGGHVDSNVQVQQVVVLPSTTFGASRNSVRDLSNIIAGAGTLGGTPYRVIVHCQDHGDGTPTSGRQLEVEFGLRFGI